MENKELVIDKNTRINSIPNKYKYTKLVLTCPVIPKSLKDFINVKELNIKEELKSENINEQNINNFIFAHMLEKITLYNIRDFGEKEIKKKKKNGSTKYEFFPLKTPNLKSISFHINFKNYYINKNYFDYCPNLEEIIFNLYDDCNCERNIILDHTKIKRIIIKFLDKEYKLDLDYLPQIITYFNVCENGKKIIIKFNNDIISTRIEINTITGKIIKNNTLNELVDSIIKDNVLEIPNYVTNINYNSINYHNAIRHIKFNTKLLDSIKTPTFITDKDKSYYEIIESIILVNSDDMALFPERVIDIKKYGIIESLYIEDYKLFIEFEKKILVVTKNEIREELKENKEEIKLINESSKEIDLNKYSVKELETYLYYRKLLEITEMNRDNELNSAMKIVGDRIIKKLIK